MSIDKSLKRKNTLMRQRSVLTRAERIKVLVDEERWLPERGPFGLPKVKVHKIVIKKAKKAKAEEAVPGAEGATAPAAAAAEDKKGAAAKPAAAKPAAKKEDKKK